MNAKHFKLLALLAVLLMQNGCAERSVKGQHHGAVNDAAIVKEQHHEAVSDASIENEQYHEALKDAAIVEKDDIYNNLQEITRNNADLKWNEDKTRVLVVTWKSNGSYKDYIQNKTQTSTDPNYATWVTAAPQVKTFCQSYLRENPKATDDQLNLRLKQYLGLPADGNYDVFVELWVRPEDMFRPCVDTEINDKKCDLKIPLCFPSVANIPDYGAFYKNLYFTRFRESNRYPWTGMGYTYDWGNQKSKFGASEFILIPNTPYQIKQKQPIPTREYCKQQ